MEKTNIKVVLNKEDKELPVFLLNCKENKEHEIYYVYAGQIYVCHMARMYMHLKNKFVSISLWDRKG